MSIVLLLLLLRRGQAKIESSSQFNFCSNFKNSTLIKNIKKWSDTIECNLSNCAYVNYIRNIWKRFGYWFPPCGPEIIIFIAIVRNFHMAVSNFIISTRSMIQTWPFTSLFPWTFWNRPRTWCAAWQILILLIVSSINLIYSKKLHQNVYSLNENDARGCCCGRKKNPASVTSLNSTGPLLMIAWWSRHRLFHIQIKY